MGAKYGKYSSLVAYYDDPLVNVVIMSLIVIGGIGFVVWGDLLKNRWHFKKYLLHTNIDEYHFNLWWGFALLLGGKKWCAQGNECVRTDFIQPLCISYSKNGRI